MVSYKLPKTKDFQETPRTLSHMELSLLVSLPYNSNSDQSSKIQEIYFFTLILYNDPMKLSLLIQRKPQIHTGWDQWNTIDKWISHIVIIQHLCYWSIHCKTCFSQENKMKHNSWTSCLAKNILYLCFMERRLWSCFIILKKYYKLKQICRE